MSMLVVGASFKGRPQLSFGYCWWWRIIWTIYLLESINPLLLMFCHLCLLCDAMRIVFFFIHHTFLKRGVCCFRFRVPSKLELRPRRIAATGPSRLISIRNQFYNRPSETGVFRDYPPNTVKYHRTLKYLPFSGFPAIQSNRDQCIWCNPFDDIWIASDVSYWISSCWPFKVFAAILCCYLIPAAWLFVENEPFLSLLYYSSP